MTATQKLAIALLVIGLFLSASPLLTTLATQGLVAPECLQIDLASHECTNYSGSVWWTLYITFIAVGQKYMFFIIPIGIVLIVTAFILSFIQAPKYNSYS